MHCFGVIVPPFRLMTLLLEQALLEETRHTSQLKLQVDEDEFKSAISRALSHAGAHVSVEHQERGRSHVHMLITLPWRFSDGSEPVCTATVG